MLNVTQTKQNLLQVENVDSIEFYNYVICCFDTTDHEIIVEGENGENNIDFRNGYYYAYENIKNKSTIFKFKVENMKIVGVWEY